MDLKNKFVHEQNAKKNIHAEQKKVLAHRMVPKNIVHEQNDLPPPTPFTFLVVRTKRSKSAMHKTSQAKLNIPYQPLLIKPMYGLHPVQHLHSR